MMNDDPKLKMAAVLNWHDIDLIRDLLAPVPFAHAQPIYQMLLESAAHQVANGLHGLVQAAVEEHRNREALLGLAVPQHSVN